jgi:hypothetical protein
MTFGDFIKRGNGTHSSVLYGALGDIKEASSDLCKLNGTASRSSDNDLLDRLRVVIEFIQEAVQIIENNGVSAVDLMIRNRGKNPRPSNGIYDQIANLVYKVIDQASAVSSPKDTCWWIQYNALWSELFNFGRLEGQAGNIVKAKVCRLLYKDVLEMNRYPNFQGARILGFCLNVMGLQRAKGDIYNDSRALHTAILFWTRKNFDRLHDYDPRVAAACLVDGMTYDPVKHRIVKEYLRLPGQSVAPCVYLNLDPQASKAKFAGRKSSAPTKNKPIKGPRPRRTPL